MSTEAPGPVKLAPLPEAPLGGRACVVLLGGRPFAVDVTDAREVVVVDTTTPVPGAPPSLIGVMNLRGTVLPVVEARPLLGLPVRTGSDRALVVADGERRAAIVIEAVLGLTALDDVQPAASDAAPAAVADEPSRATLLDARAILAAIRRAWDPAPGG